MLRSIGIAALSRQAHIIAVDLQVFAGSVRRVEHIDQLEGAAFVVLGCGL